MLKSKALGFLPLIIYLTKIQGHLLVLIEISKKFMFISHREHKVTRLNKGIIFDIYNINFYLCFSIIFLFLNINNNNSKFIFI
jgi:hypothetical protein